MECTLCKKQYVGKAETPFNIRVNNYIKDIKNTHPKTILECKNLQETNHNFKIHYHRQTYQHKKIKTNSATTLN